VAWSGTISGASGIFANRVDAAGNLIDNGVAVSTDPTAIKRAPDVAMNDSGSFVVAWESDGQDGDDEGIYARLYAADGSTIRQEFLVNTTTANEQRFPKVAIDEDGDFVVVWRAYDGSGFGVFAQRFDSLGNAQGDEFRVNTFTGGHQSNPDVAMDADGDFVVTWHSVGPLSSDFAIYARRYDADGLAIGESFLVGETQLAPQNDASIAMTAEGSFAVVWTNHLDNGSKSITARRFGSDGIADGGDIFVANYSISISTAQPDIALGEDGEVIVSWAQNGSVGGNVDVFTRSFTPAGATEASAITVNNTTNGFQGEAAVAFDSQQRAFIVWNGADRIYERRFLYTDVEAIAGGPYLIIPESSLTLDATGSSAATEYDWDINGDGIYGDASGLMPTLSWSELQSFGIGEGTYSVRVRLASNPVIVSAATTLTVKTFVAEAGGPYFIASGNALTLDASGSNDPDAEFRWDLNGDGIFSDALGKTVTLSWTDLANLGLGVGSWNIRVEMANSLITVQSEATPFVAYALEDLAGGPYTVLEGDSLLLQVPAAYPANIFEYSWDINGDGIYGDAVGASISLSWTQLISLGIDDGPALGSVRVQVSGGSNPVIHSDAVALTIDNRAPATAAILGPVDVRKDQLVMFTLTATDPSPVDAAAGYTFSIDWDSDGTIDEIVIGPSGTEVSHTFTSYGVTDITVHVSDKDGAIRSGTSRMLVFDWSMITDSVDPSKSNLIVNGTDGADAFAFLPGGNLLVFALNNTFLAVPTLVITGPFNGTLIANGKDGNDLLLGDILNRNAILTGGGGDDVIVGGKQSDQIDGGTGRDILYGGTAFVDAADTIYGGSGDDLIVGHHGEDEIYGGEGDDLIVAGRIAFQEIAQASFSIQSEWISGRSYEDRVANLLGIGSGPRFNGDYFLSPSDTVIDDDAADAVFGEADQDFFLVSSIQDSVDSQSGETTIDVSGSPPLAMVAVGDLVGGSSESSTMNAITSKGQADTNRGNLEASLRSLRVQQPGIDLVSIPYASNSRSNERSSSPVRYVSRSGAELVEPKNARLIDQADEAERVGDSLDAETLETEILGKLTKVDS
jgi:hypothetical protein